MNRKIEQFIKYDIDKNIYPQLFIYFFKAHKIY